MGEVKDRDGKYGELSPAMMFCMIVAGGFESVAHGL
jgi:hypothetical protein